MCVITNIKWCVANKKLARDNQNRMRYDTMDERKRFRAFVGILIVVIAVGGVFGVGAVVAEGDAWAIVTSIAILAALALVAVVAIRKRLKDMESGFPSEDERSAAVKMRIGYLSFWVSVYFCFALGWIINLFVEDTSTQLISLEELMFVVAGVMCLIFIVLWAALSRGKGVQ
jgi:hypothetical protein